MKHIFSILLLLALQNSAKAAIAAMDPVYILKADMVCTNGKTISGYFTDYEFQGMVTSKYDGEHPLTTILPPQVLDNILQDLKAVDRSQNESFFGFTLYKKAFTKDMFADSTYLGRHTFLLSDNSDSIKWTDIKSVLKVSIEGAQMPEPDLTLQPSPFQIDYTESPVVPKMLFETIENQKIVNYFIYEYGKDGPGQAIMLINYNPSITVQQLEEWAKMLSQYPIVYPEGFLNLLLEKKVVTIGGSNAC